MNFSLGLVALAWLTGAAPAVEQENTRQIPTPRPYRVDHERAEAVKDVFHRSWEAYRSTAFPHDTLKPVTQSYNNDRNGWGASAVDALSTAILMENWHVVGQILDFVPLVDFDKAQGSISVFETTIRYIGGLLSGYDLLTGPYRKYAPRRGGAVSALLSQAEKLAGNLAVAFDTPSGLPENIVVIDPIPAIDPRGFNTLATAGTLVLEWTHLSDLTGNPIWRELASKGESYLLEPRGGVITENYFTGDGVWVGSADIEVDPEPFPGLVGTCINTTDGRFLDGRGGWHGGCDSFYEYLIKMYVYDPTTAQGSFYRERWTTAADSSIRYLASHPSSNPSLMFLSAFDGKKLQFQSQHLACFDGGNFIMGGLLLDSPQHLNFGIHLTHSCHATYAGTATGIGPEMFAWQDSRSPPPVQSTTHSYGPGDIINQEGGGKEEAGSVIVKTSTSGGAFDQLTATTATTAPPDYVSTVPEPALTTSTSSEKSQPTQWMAPNGAIIGDNNPPPPDQQAFYDANGFWIVRSDYLLRPEVIESYYYAYRATGDTKYQDWAWDAFVAINRTCSVWASVPGEVQDPLPTSSRAANESNGPSMGPAPSETSKFLGYSSIYNVDSPHGGGSQDFMESFWFAEVLKYLYLIYAEDSVIQFQAVLPNTWVFNTEAHPLRVSAAALSL